MAATTPTNPNRVVRVKDLNRFKTKADERYGAVAYASDSTCEDIISELT